jgi:hypothetical protein
MNHAPKQAYHANATPNKAPPTTRSHPGSDSLRALADRSKTSAATQKLQALQQRSNQSSIIQRRIQIHGDKRRFYSYGGNATKALVKEIDESGVAIKRGWKSELREMAKSRVLNKFPSLNGLIAELVKVYPPQTQNGPYGRPNFSQRAYNLAKISASLSYRVDLLDIALAANDLALPHRMSFRDIRESTRRFAENQEDDSDLTRWTERLIDGTLARIAQSTKAFADIQSDRTLKAVFKKKAQYMRDARLSVSNAEAARDELIKATKANDDPRKNAAIKEFLKAFNEIHGNIPDVGQHTAVNVVVSSAAHLHTQERQGRSRTRTAHHSQERELTPGSRAVRDMSPHRLGRGIAFDSTGQLGVEPSGRFFNTKSLDPDSQKKLKRHAYKKTNVTKKRLDADSKKRKRDSSFDPSQSSRPFKKPRNTNSSS